MTSPSRIISGTQHSYYIRWPLFVLGQAVKLFRLCNRGHQQINSEVIHGIYETLTHLGFDMQFDGQGKLLLIPTNLGGGVVTSFPSESHTNKSSGCNTKAKLNLQFKDIQQQ